jgi:hypothetical protein
LLELLDQVLMLWLKIPSISGIKLCTGLWDPCVLITVLALFDGYVLRKTRRFGKTDVMLAKFSKMAKTAPEEIQQQMQDNIQWIKGAQENKLVVGSQARILYADAEGRVKLPKHLIRLLPR